MNAPNVTHARVEGDGEVHLVLLTAADTTLCGKAALPHVGPDDPTCDACVLEYRRFSGPGPGEPSSIHAALYAAQKAKGRPVHLTDAEIDLLRGALDSHIYWQLSDEEYRDSGFVQDPGSDDPEAVEAIKEANALDAKLAGEARGDG